MPRIAEEHPYNGALERIERLGLRPLVDELRQLLTGFSLLVREEVDANGGAAVRRMIDEEFRRVGGWAIGRSGEIDWQKCVEINGTRLCVGVEIQFSARSDLLVIDVIHLREAIIAGQIDIGLLVVPTNRLSRFLTDRGPSITAAMRIARAAQHHSHQQSRILEVAHTDQLRES